MHMAAVIGPGTLLRMRGYTNGRTDIVMVVRITDGMEVAVDGPLIWLLCGTELIDVAEGFLQEHFVPVRGANVDPKGG